MKNRLNYIPTKSQLDELRQQLYASSQSPMSASPQPSSRTSNQPSPHKPLSKSDIDSLIARLAQNTRSKQIRCQLQKIKETNIRHQRQGRTHANEPRIQERLMQEGREREERRSKMQKEWQLQEKKELREKPQISNNVQIVQKPIKDRYKEVISDREKHLKDLNKKYKPAFTPQINTYSKFIAEIRNQNDMNIVNRLEKQGNVLQQRKQRIVNKIDQQLNLQNTFKPKINTKTNSILSNNPLFAAHIPFQKRIQYLQRKNRSREASPPEPECTFQPKICSKSSKLVQQQESSVGERLYLHAQKMKEKKAKKKEEIERQYSFQPKINKVKIAVTSNYAESSESYFSSDEESLFKQPSQPRRRSSCSIRHSQVKSRYLESSRKQASQMTADQKVQQRCTFKPSLFQPIKVSQVPQVYGLDSYLRNIDRARRLQLEKAAATQKVQSEKYLQKMY